MASRDVESDVDVSFTQERGASSRASSNVSMSQTKGRSTTVSPASQRVPKAGKSASSRRHLPEQSLKQQLPRKQQHQRLPKVNKKSRALSVSPVPPEDSNVVVTESSDDDDVSFKDSESLYCKRPPIDSPFSTGNIGPYRDDWLQALPHLNVFADSSKLREATLKFSKKPIDKSHFCQFVYKKPPTLFLVTNAYGLTITHSEDYLHRTILRHINQLEPKHRVQLLVPTVNYWWHEDSRTLMQDFIERFVMDVKVLASVPAFVEACKRFNILDNMKQIFANLRKKLLTAKDGRSSSTGQETPGIFGFRVFNSNDMPSRITSPLFLFQKINREMKMVTWQHLIQPTYVHAMMLLQVRGFKITRNGISLDMSVESMAYLPIEFQRQDRSQDFATAMSQRCKLFKMSKDSSSSDDDGPSSSQYSQGVAVRTDDW